MALSWHVSFSILAGLLLLPQGVINTNRSADIYSPILIAFVSSIEYGKGYHSLWHAAHVIPHINVMEWRLEEKM